MSNIDPYTFESASASLPYHGGVPIYPPDYFQPVRSLDFARAMRAPFKSPNWIVNVVWLFLCNLASVIIVGNVIMLGYLAEVAESRSWGKEDHWPDFKLERVTDYLMRGLWPFLWHLIWSIPMTIVMFIPVGLTGFLSSTLAHGNQQAAALIVGGLGGIVCFAILLAVGTFMLASMMHAGLGNDFMKGADFGWILSFVSKMLMTSVLAGICLWLLAMAASVVGMAACCIGLFVTIPYVHMVSADIVCQLHDIFVTRGGKSAF